MNKLALAGSIALAATAAIFITKGYKQGAANGRIAAAVAADMEFKAAAIKQMTAELAEVGLDGDKSAEIIGKIIAYQDEIDNYNHIIRG